MSIPPIQVTVWGENLHEKVHPPVARHYPLGMHEAIAAPLRRDPALAVRCATLDQLDHGLTPEVLATTQVLIWWGHMGHDRVEDRIVAEVRRRVLEGMGLIVLHSGHHAKIFKALMGTTCSLKWRDATDKERLWVVTPSHPIAAGLPEHFELPIEEMYGEPFDIPTPDELIFLSWFTGGEVFRSGATWRRGHGKVFYFRPGHEMFPTYHDPNVQRVIRNAVHWARETVRLPDAAPMTPPLEPLPPGPRP